MELKLKRLGVKDLACHSKEFELYCGSCHCHFKAEEQCGQNYHFDFFNGDLTMCFTFPVIKLMFQFTYI